MALFIASFTMSGLNIVATIFSLRAPGMSMMRMPLTVWKVPARYMSCLAEMVDSGLLLSPLQSMAPMGILFLG